MVQFWGVLSHTWASLDLTAGWILKSKFRSPGQFCVLGLIPVWFLWLDSCFIQSCATENVYPFVSISFLAIALNSLQMIFILKYNGFLKIFPDYLSTLQKNKSKILPVWWNISRSQKVPTYCIQIWLRYCQSQVTFRQRNVKVTICYLIQLICSYVRYWSEIRIHHQSYWWQVLQILYVLLF